MNATASINGVLFKDFEMLLVDASRCELQFGVTQARTGFFLWWMQLRPSSGFCSRLSRLMYFDISRFDDTLVEKPVHGFIVMVDSDHDNRLMLLLIVKVEMRVLIDLVRLIGSHQDL